MPGGRTSAPQVHSRINDKSLYLLFSLIFIVLHFLDSFSCENRQFLTKELEMLETKGVTVESGTN